MEKFVKVKPQSRASMVVEELTNSIINGDLSDGELLPPENKLCEIFGVSRSILREAIKVLVSRGLLDVRQGHGTRVLIPKGDIPEEALNTYLKTNALSFLQLMEVRAPLEIQIARLAALRRKDVHLAALEECLQIMEGHPFDLESMVTADDNFHQILLEATENPIYQIIIRPLIEYLHMSRQLTIGQFGTEIVIKQHWEVYEAIKAQDIARAAACMEEQMTTTLQHLQKIENEDDA